MEPRKTSGLFTKLWKDDFGFVHGTNYLLMTTIICIGAVAGLTTVRDSVVQSLGDVALALQHLDQSYTVTCSFGSFGFMDDVAPDDVSGQPPNSIAICLPSTNEGAN